MSLFSQNAALSKLFAEFGVSLAEHEGLGTECIKAPLKTAQWFF
jgi:hypothetical protein